MNIRIRKLVIVGTALSVLTLTSSCDRWQSDDASRTENLVKSATVQEDQWEYLVVSFGKTTYENIEENIKNGHSKLVAFKEFSSLLAGHEGIELQTKLDILGRFGWDLVDTIGAISGDQQLVLKRERINNRIEIEQEALKTLSVILKQESEQKGHHSF